jgi:hypothetical protein
VLVQNLLMRRWGGCGMIPSGTYYSQVPTTVLNDSSSVDGHALDLLPEMVLRYAPVADRDALDRSPVMVHDPSSPQYSIRSALELDPR